MNLFATKPLDLLMKEAEESGSHSLKRTLGPFQLTAWAWEPSSAPESSCCRDWARITPDRA